MAHPGYPGQPHGPFPGPPAAASPPAAAPRRKGTSKAVPIVVSIALAAGTFTGLTLGLGTGEASSTQKEGEGGDPTGDEGARPEVAAKDGDKPAEGKAGDGKDGDKPAEGKDGKDGDKPAGDAVAAADGAKDGAKPADGAKDGDKPADAGKAGGGTAAPAVVTARITIEVEPADAKVTVDGKDVTDGVFELELPGGANAKKTVTVAAKASGHASYSKKHTITGDTTLPPIKLRKRTGSSGGTGGTGGTTGGGIIDL